MKIYSLLEHLLMVGKDGKDSNVITVSFTKEDVTQQMKKTIRAFIKMFGDFTLVSNLDDYAYFQNNEEEFYELCIQEHEVKHPYENTSLIDLWI